MLLYVADGVSATQAISLGVHCVSGAFPEAMLLMEVLPALLAARDFPRLASARMLELGYRDSPDPSAVAIVFVMVSALLLRACWSWATGTLPTPLPWPSSLSL